jgi:hypothetical protein
MVTAGTMVKKIVTDISDPGTHAKTTTMLIQSTDTDIDTIPETVQGTTAVNVIMTAIGIENAEVQAGIPNT